MSEHEPKKILPTNSVWRDLEPRRYDFCSDKREIQVYFKAMSGEHYSVPLDPDYVPDCDRDPVLVAKDVLDVLDERYIYHGGTYKLRAVLEAMEACHSESEQNRRVNRIHELRHTIETAEAEYRELTGERYAEVSDSLPRIHPITGAEYYISNGLPGSTKWATYIRKPNGSLKRVKSKYLPLRETPREALEDLDIWLAQTNGGAK